MSSTAAQRNPAQQVRARLAPWLDGSALDRARLTVVPRRQTSAARLPFVLLVSLILVGGVVGLLCFNTSMQQAAFSENKLQDEATNLAARQQTLQLQLQTMQDPQTIAAKAQRLGMVIPGAPALLHVPSGKVEGDAQPATRDFTPPLYPHMAKPKPLATTPARR
jgi:cell division protein FtsB